MNNFQKIIFLNKVLHWT